MKRNELLLPRGYRSFNQEGYEMLGDGEDEFNIKNRSFSQVDNYFSHAISKKIDERRANQDCNVQILDLAGGTDSRATNDLQERYGDCLHSINVDIAHNIVKESVASRVQGNALQLPISDGVIDIAFSCQFLPFLNRFGRDHDLQVARVLKEVVRVMKPGSVAYVDDEEEFSGPSSDTKRKELADKLGVTLDTQDSQLLIKEKRTFPKFWQAKIRLEKFLVIRK